MGITYVDAEVTGPTGKSEAVRLLVDSGATYTLLPEQVWKAIELEPTREISFRLADGSRMVRQASECYISLDHGEGHSPVILGEPGDVGLLGVVTLENFGPVFNPLSRTLHPMRFLLMAAGGGSREHTALQTPQSSK